MGSHHSLKAQENETIEKEEEITAKRRNLSINGVEGHEQGKSHESGLRNNDAFDGENGKSTFAFEYERASAEGIEDTSLAFLGQLALPQKRRRSNISIDDETHTSCAKAYRKLSRFLFCFLSFHHLEHTSRLEDSNDSALN